MSEYIIGEDDLRLCERCADRFTESIERNSFEVLIRCYDCEWFDVPEREYCRLWNRHSSGHDFCSYADPK